MKKFLLVLLMALPASAVAQVDSLPAGTVWYLHADLAGMRDSAAGRELYQWMDAEIFTEVNDETGIDLSREIDRVTAFAAEDMGNVVVLQGTVSEVAQNKLLALITLQDDGYDTRSHGDRAYYFAGDDEPGPTSMEPFSDLNESAYFSFAVNNKLLITSTEEQMHELLDSDGRIVGGGNHAGALFVLTADKSLVQAGMRTRDFVDDDDDWNSNILRNTEQVGLLIADQNGMLAVEALLKSADAGMAQSIANVVNGLIGLQAFNGDLDEELRNLIANTEVRVRDAELTLRTVLDPGLLVRMLND